MKKLLCALLALSLMLGALPRALAEAVSQEVEAGVGPALSAGGDTGLFVEGEDFAPPEEVLDEGVGYEIAPEETGDWSAEALDDGTGDEIAPEEPEPEAGEALGDGAEDGIALAGTELGAEGMALDDEAEAGYVALEDDAGDAGDGLSVAWTEAQPEAETAPEAAIEEAAEAEVELTELLAEEDGDAPEALPAEDGPAREAVPEEEFFSIDADVDSDALFAGYARSIFYGGGIPMATTLTGERLSGQNRVLYDALKQEILKVAEGSRASTEFTVKVSELLGQSRFTAADLGVALAYNPDGSLSAASIASMWQAYANRFEYDIGLVSTSLWYDCTYELYWWSRYLEGVRSSRGAVSMRYDSSLGEYVIVIPDDCLVTVSFYVLDAYAAGPYAVDTSLIQGARQAAANAKAIVEKYAGYTDYAKLYGYAVEICRLNTYNTEAASGSWSMVEQNPWKLIWVFDRDPSTNVVCEGYAQAFQYLCELTDFDSGIRCYQVDGDAGEAHAWNLVRMDDGKNYVVDVTWLDSEGLENSIASGSMADWISRQCGGLFLAGAASGSVSGGYTVNYRNGSSTTRRTYSSGTRALYPASSLTLAKSKYVLTGFQKIGGKTYFFDDEGHYVTGTRSMGDGMSYSFGSDGAMTSGWSVGWHTVDGKKYYFEEGGLHAAHDVVVDAAKAPTCTVSGLTEGSHCSVCGVVFEAQRTLAALGHDWGEASYSWSGNHATATATRTCRRDGKHVQKETVMAASRRTRAATCEGWGEMTYTATFTNAAFATQTEAVENLAPLGHAWGAASYEWSGDHGAVTARRVCGHDPSHVETETAAATASVSAPATCEDWGQTTYAASFGNGAFAAQSVTATDLAPLGHAWGEASYEWSWDHGAATARRVCGRDPGHVETETVRTSAEVLREATCEDWGETAYTAAFGGAFETQRTAAVDRAPLGHAPVTDPAVAATPTQTGLTEGSHCGVCGAVLTAQQVTPKVIVEVRMTKSKTQKAVVGSQLRITVPDKAIKGFKTSNAKVAKVTGKGLVTPVGEGTAKITVTLKNKKTLALTVKVTDPNAPKKVKILQGTKATLRLKAKKLALTAVVGPAQASQKVKWSSDNTKVATVDSRGVVTARKAGTAKITAKTANGKTATIKITVKK